MGDGQVGDGPMREKPHSADRPGREPAGTAPANSEPVGAGPVGRERARTALANSEPAGAGPVGREPAGDVRGSEWAALGEWLVSRPLLPKVDLGVLRECLGFVGRARASLAALEADVVAEVARREGDAATEEFLRRDQKRSRREARKAVKVAGQLGWAPRVADKLASGEITPEAAGLILDADAETPVDQRKLLAAAETEPDDVFRRTLKEHVNERATAQELEARRAQQQRRRRCSISEQPDGMFHLFAQLDPLVGNRVRAALVAKSDALFRSEDPKQRPTPPQRFADALADLVCSGAGNTTRNGTAAASDTTDAAGGDGGADAGRARSDNTEAGVGAGHGRGGGGPAGVELIVLADYDLVSERITNARLTDGTRLTEAETLAAACDAKILPGIFNKHTGNVVLGRSQRKVPPWLRKQLIARDGGCIGCGAHHQICEVHHIKHWKHGGETTLENTCLLCWRCHHIRLHRNGEEITRHPDGTLTLTPPTDTPRGKTARPQRPPPHDRHGTRHGATDNPAHLPAPLPIGSRPTPT